MPNWWEEPQQWWEDPNDYIDRTTSGPGTTGGPVGGTIVAPTGPDVTGGGRVGGSVETIYDPGDPNEGFGGGWGGASPFMGAHTLSFDLGTAPRFVAPRFTAPTGESVRNEPGYAFGLDEGERALQQSAAGKGVLRTGGTLKDINAWGQNYAGQKYTDAFNRALSSFDREYAGSLDMYKPLLTEWQTNAAAQQRAAELNFQRQWDQYVFGADDAFRRWEAETRFNLTPPPE